LAALFVLTSFSDRLRDMVTGVTAALGGEQKGESKDSKDIIKELTKDGIPQ
jgi:hypothetical protein